MNINLRKMVTAGMMVALTVSLSSFSIPIGASKCYPIQHMVNVISAVFLGPVYGVMEAFCTSLIRNMMGTGSLLAFPGSMAGALLCGLVYQYTRKLWLTYAGEVVGTGLIGGMLCYPVASWVMGKEAALFTYVVPFLMSTACGTCMAVILVGVLSKTRVLNVLKMALEG